MIEAIAQLAHAGNNVVMDTIRLIERNTFRRHCVCCRLLIIDKAERNFQFNGEVRTDIRAQIADVKPDEFMVTPFTE